MDRKLGDILGRFTNAPGLLLPRVASGTTTITKLSVIGERQRFGLRVLEAGFHVLFVDLDALFLRSPEPLLRDGDIIGERIWGRPRNVVQKWGAAICTGFYFLRATAANVAIFRKTHHLIAEKRQRQPKWQASDQWAINNALDQQVGQMGRACRREGRTCGLVGKGRVKAIDDTTGGARRPPGLRRRWSQLAALGRTARHA